MKKQKSTIALFIAGSLIGGLLALALSSHVTPGRSKKIRRTILLNFKPEASPAQVQKILQEVKENIAQMNGVHNIVAGPQINEKANFKYGISMDFDDEAALKAYRQNEGHRQTHNEYGHLIEQSQITDLREE